VATGELVIGVDIGGSKLAAGLVDDRLRILKRLQRSMRGQDTPVLLDTVAGAVEELVNTAPSEVAAVGFGIPSLIDRRSGSSLMAVNLPLAGVRFGALMSERLGLPVFVDNDGNLAALAEHRAGAGVGVAHMVLVGLGTGISSGLILGGELYRGSIGAGAELGHMVIDLNGPPCQGNCPNHGCFESLASGTALAREARAAAASQPDSALGRAQREGRELDGPLVAELAHDGDQAARAVIELIGMRVGVATANIVNIFNPELVVVGGGVMGAGEMLLAPARAEFARRALPPLGAAARVVAATFAHEAGLVGAALLALDGLAARREQR
jgi:glucokinase